MEGTEPSPARGALAGMLGAASALVVLEVAGLFAARRTTVIEAVGNRFIDGFAASLKDLAIALFGRNDKVALQIGTVVVALAIGAALGTQLARRPNVVVAGFGAFALLGMWATWVDPFGSGIGGVVACAVAALVGTSVAIGLDRRWRGVVGDAVAADPVEGEVVGRRTVLLNSGVFAGLLLLGVGAVRSARASLRENVSTVAGRLPRAERRVEVPDGVLDDDPDAAGITPYLTPNEDFFRIDTALSVPLVDVGSWRLRVRGMVDRELELTYDQILARTMVELPITIQCVSNEVGGDLVGNARWTGFPLAELLEEAGVQDGVEQVMTESVDGFTAGFPLEAALDGRDALVVVGMNGEPLPRVHGYPVRLVVPGLYGYVSATKWLQELRLTTWDEEGFWIPRGWSRLGPIKVQSRIDVPAAGAEVAAGRVAVAGVAWAPTRGIEAVEVRVDGGRWSRATLGPTASEDTWVQWWWAWDAEPGAHELEVRAVTADGEVQTAEQARPAPDGATGHHRVEVAVR